MSVAGFIQHRGAAVTYTLVDAGTYDEDAGTWSGSTATTVAGYHLRVPGDPERYRALELIESLAPSFEFTPTTAGEIPPLGATFTDGPDTFVVRDVQPIYLRGVATRTRVIGVGADGD